MPDPDDIYTTESIDALAEDLCEMDATMADAVLDNASNYPGWSRSNEERREMWRNAARLMVERGEAVIEGAE